jgi:hypothetical protein
MRLLRSHATTLSPLGRVKRKELNGLDFYLKARKMEIIWRIKNDILFTDGCGGGYRRGLGLSHDPQRALAHLRADRLWSCRRVRLGTGQARPGQT